MKAIICGGRDFNNYEFLKACLYPYDIEFVIEGGATGADRLARKWAFEHGIACATVHAQWGRYGLGAGPMRNNWMLSLQPDIVFAFPGGKGTANMMRQAYQQNVKIVEFM